MSKKTWIIIGLQTFIIIVLFWLLVFYGKDEYEEIVENEEEEIETLSMVSQTNDAGIATLKLNKNIQAQSDIQIATLDMASHEGGISSFGNVMNITTLLDSRAKYLSALADKQLAQAAANSSQQEFQRMKMLNLDDKNVSDRALALATSNFKSDQAKINAASLAAKNLRDAMRQEWGETLTQWATSEKISPKLEKLLQQKAALISITLPFNSPTPTSSSAFKVIPVGVDSAGIIANYLSPATMHDISSQGKTYFYLADTDQLRSGMRVAVEGGNQSELKMGVLIPHKAVVWHANQAWVYQKTGLDTFIRRPVQTDIELEGGWFNAGSSLSVGDVIVTGGAQLLLSEEFKSLITNENDD